jgi:hypothetical protein
MVGLCRVLKLTYIRYHGMPGALHHVHPQVPGRTTGCSKNRGTVQKRLHPAARRSHYRCLAVIALVQLLLITVCTAIKSSLPPLPAGTAAAAGYFPSACAAATGGAAAGAAVAAKAAASGAPAGAEPEAQVPPGWPTSATS